MTFFFVPNAPLRLNRPLYATPQLCMTVSAHPPLPTPTSPDIPVPAHVTSHAQLRARLEADVRNLLILKVYSRRCRSCKRIERPFERMATAYESRVAFLQLCADDDEHLAQKLGVRGFPTFVVFKKRKRVDHFATSCPDTLEEHIEDWL